MRRLFLLAVAVFAALWLLTELNVLPAPIAGAVGPIVGLGCSLAIPGLFLIAYTVPGLFRELADDVSHFWRRLRTRRHDLEELERKIAHLDRAYHMQQLGMLYAAQGRPAKARPWFERANWAGRSRNRWKPSISSGCAILLRKSIQPRPSCLKPSMLKSPSTITA